MNATTRCEVLVAPTVRCQLTQVLSTSVAFAAHGFIIGALAADPYRAGRRLRAPLSGHHSAHRGTYRVIYRIDEQRRRVTVVGVFSRAATDRGSARTAGV